MADPQVSLVEDFWLAVARNDRAGAEAAAASIEVPLVALAPAYSFELVEDEVPGGEDEQEDTGTLFETPRAVRPDTPVATVDAWNAEVGVSLVLVSKIKTCGARVSGGEVDFLACAGDNERPGSGGCGWTTHELGGRDSNKKPVVKMAFPERGDGYAILVKSSGAKIQRPKIFSLPILAKDDLPFPETIEWDLPLLSFKFKAREWKLFVEGYLGASWFADLWTRTEETQGQEPRPLFEPRRSELASHDDEMSERSNLEGRVPFEVPISVAQYFGARTSGSGHSVRSRDKSLGGASRLSGPNERLAPFLRRIQSLENRAAILDDSLPRSFGLVRDEMNLLWKELEELRDLAPRLPREDAPTNLFESRRPAALPTGGPRLSGADFEQLMSQVFDELRASGFIRQSDLDARVHPGLPAEILLQISGLSKRVSMIEKDLRDPEGTLARLEGRLKSLEDRRAGDAIERGGKTFRDITSVSAFLQTFPDKNLYRYCVDMVTLVMLCAEAYETIAEGMATAAAAHKAEYNSLTEARISLSYGLTYPENIMKKMDKQKHAATGGWYWTTSWSTFSAFKGTFNNGAKDGITSALREVSGMIQNAIDFAFPLTTHPLAHAVFTEQLLLSRAQASEWIDALEPLYEILSSAGMPTDDAWERVLIFTKAVFDDVRTVRALTMDSKNNAGMIWGSFKTTKLLEEYRRLKFYQHPHVSNMLALTSLQREGKKVENTLSALGTLTKDVEKLKTQCGQVERDVKSLKNASK